MDGQGLRIHVGRARASAWRLFTWGALIATVQLLLAAPAAAQNLIQDPQFESGVSGFFAQNDTDQVALNTTTPLQGASSLSVSINSYGNSVWWVYPFAGGLASHLQVSARLRSDLDSSSVLQFCASYYLSGNLNEICTNVSGAVGDKGVVTAQVDIDPTLPIDDVRVHISQVGNAPVEFTLDDAAANLVVVQAPPDGGGGSTGGGTGTGTGTTDSCAVNPNSAYHPVAYTLPTTRPFLSLASFTHVSQTSPAYTRFKQVVDQALAGNPSDDYSAAYSIIMYRITGSASYLNDAITRVDAFVNQAKTDAQAGVVPQLAHDHFYFFEQYMEPLALTYDSGFALLTPTQQSNWSDYAEQSLQNLWISNPKQTWYGIAFPDETGWALCDPGDNYYFGFLQGTMLWALASQGNEWINFLQTKKFPPLIDYYAQFPGGGTREGTGYGTALQNLLKNYIYWKDSTGEDLAGITPHTRETIDYWVHATVPTRDRFAPIGDLSRESIPNLYDYQRNLVHEAVVLSSGTSQAQRGTWWLQNISVAQDANSFNYWGDLLPLPDSPSAPTDLVYNATGAGVLFARSSWGTDASWLEFVAGRYDQSHAHQEQGSFTFFRNDWLSVTQNIWSHSGLRQEVKYQNGLRFENASGAVIPQVPTDNSQPDLQSTMTYTNSSGVVSIAADLSNAYWHDSGSVQQWKRNLQFSGNSLQITDACTVASGVRPVFQLQVPVQPVLQSDGKSVVAGNLSITPLNKSDVSAPAFVSVVAEAPPETDETFSKGYRIEYTSTVGCSFNFQLQAQ